MNTNHVYQAINAITASLAKAGVSKDRRNTNQNYNFRGIEDVYSALAPRLAEHNLCIIPRVIDHSCTAGQNKSGNANYHVFADVEFDIVSAVDGSHHTARTIGEAMDSQDKSANKAMSAAYKYMAFQVFCIPVEGMDDADAHTPDPAPPGTRAESLATAEQVDRLQDWQMVEDLPPDYMKAVTGALELDGALKLTAARAQKILDGLTKNFNPRNGA